MAAERNRPPLSEMNETVTSQELRDGDEVTGTVEVHSFDAVPFEPSEALKAAIQAGHVKTTVETVEYDVKDNDGNVVKRFQQPITRCDAVNQQGAIALPNIDGDASKIWKFVSDGAHRGVFQNVYVDMRNAGKGPEAAIKRLAKILDSLTEDQKLVALKELGLIS